MADSPSKDVMKKTMGEDFHGPLLVEGWRAYSHLTIIQRCWAHLIREVGAFKSSEEGTELSEKIHGMFREMKESLKSGNTDECKSMKGLSDRRMEEIVNGYDPYGELHKTVE